MAVKKRKKARTWRLPDLIHEGAELWARCRSIHAPSLEHPITVEAGYSIGFSITDEPRDRLVATCLRCGATFTELDEVENDQPLARDLAQLAAEMGVPYAECDR